MAAQELDPDTYAIVPRAVNVISTSYVNQWGDVSFDPSLPVEDASARINVMSLAYGRTLNFFGRSASIAAGVPYGVGNLRGVYLGEFQSIYRSGLADPRARFTVNLWGGPSMTLKELAQKPRKTTVGVSFSLIAPLGQYDPHKLVNLGANRWGLRPEIGVSHQFNRRWRAEAYFGTWFFTDNQNFNGGMVRSQKPITSTQVHGYYVFRRGLWLSVNANYYYGGRTSVNQRVQFDLLANSRVGATLALPIGRRQSLRFAISQGAVTRIGADFISAGMSYSYIWGGGF